MTNNGSCSQICMDADPGYTCSCDQGYELYVYPEFNNISLVGNEDGTRPGDVIHINHTCVRKFCKALTVCVNIHCTFQHLRLSICIYSFVTLFCESY